MHHPERIGGQLRAGTVEDQGSPGDLIQCVVVITHGYHGALNAVAACGRGRQVGLFAGNHQAVAKCRVVQVECQQRAVRCRRTKAEGVVIATVGLHRLSRPMYCSPELSRERRLVMFQVSLPPRVIPEPTAPLPSRRISKLSVVSAPLDATSSPWPVSKATGLVPPNRAVRYTRLYASPLTLVMSKSSLRNKCSSSTDR